MTWPKRLKWSRVDTTTRLPDGRILLKVLFLDSEGGTYEWAPKWEDVQQLFRKSLELENFNVPTSGWIKEFATTAKEVFDRCAGQIADAHLDYGTLWEVREGKLVVGRDYQETLYPAAFELTRDWLDRWLNQYVRVLVINGVVVDVR